MQVSTDPLEHLQAEFARLDVLLHREILRLRARYQLSLDEFRGLYLSDQQVDGLINQAAGEENAAPTVAELTDRAEAMHRSNSKRTNDNLPWTQVVREFGLSQFEQDVLLLALAPEIDLKYESLYAYLNNDVTRKWPTCDLALRLFSRDPAERMSLQRHLLPDAPLFGSGILELLRNGPEHPSCLSRGFSLAPLVTHYLLGLPALDPHLSSLVEQRMPSTGWDEVPVSPDFLSALSRLPILFKDSLSNKPAPLLLFEGRLGAGRTLAAEALCRALSIPLLRVDIESVRASPKPLQKVLQALVLHQRLHRVGIYIDEIPALFDKERNATPEAYGAIRQLARMKGPIFLACPPDAYWREILRGQRYLVFRFHDPDYTERRRLWETYATQTGRSIEEPVLEAVANRFVLTPGQIKHAVSTAVCVNTLSKEVSSSRILSLDQLFEAARAQSDQGLGGLALRVNAIHTWHDLVLPAATLRQVREVAAAIKYRHVVYSEWEFEQRIAAGKGLKVLFSGASGTGKTMTAGVIARELGLDLYKIDLSGIVSKYIGETEKNLDRIFRAAHCSNAILFFDEADALFGKRSEVKDAHDRYANIELAYLLQKMDEYEGAVILASNLSKNIDQAFCRRMHYVVEFPLPDEKHREQLWRGMFPARVPLGEDVDFDFLSKHFATSGGEIQNIALDAAFLATQDGRLITMKQLIKAMARQMIKQGKIPSPTDFKQYHALIAE